jgi:hypothetical protein
VGWIILIWRAGPSVGHCARDVETHLGVALANDFEPMWNCRVCTSGALLAHSHIHCPNCGHARDIERSWLPDWDNLVRASEHRFSGAVSRCCGQGWSAGARWCGACGGHLASGDRAPIGLAALFQAAS